MGWAPFLFEGGGMPVSGYFKGEGSKVMRNMKRQYGQKKGKKVFYATANKQGLTAKKVGK